MASIKKLEVTERLPPECQLPELSDEHIAQYERALDDMLWGRWGEAFERLHRAGGRRPRERFSHRPDRPAQPH